MKLLIKKLIWWRLFFFTSLKFHNFFNAFFKRNSIKNIRCKGENEWLKKWARIGVRIDPIYYRLYSSYIGANLDIVPDNICYTIINPILNPKRYMKFYSDKNTFDILFPKGILASTILRKMDGTYLNANYEFVNLDDIILFKLLDGYNKIIIKPSLDSSSGVGVKVFVKNSKAWCDYSNENVFLCYSFLEETYGDNFIIQEYLEQSLELSKYNDSSVNTIRMTLYKSVKTNQPCITSAVLRIGKKGSVVDNAHSGGRYIGISQDGTLGKSTFDQFGSESKYFNGINFENFHQIPNWNQLVDFSKSLGKYVPHCRLIALDIMIAKDGNPRLVEFNVSAYSPWLFQFSIGTAFGQYADEIIEYSKNRYSSLVFSNNLG